MTHPNYGLTVAAFLFTFEEATVAPAIRADQQKPCEHCGKMFPDPKHRQRFCSRKCAGLKQNLGKAPVRPSKLARLSTSAVWRRYCPACRCYKILPGQDVLPGAEVCLCGAKASRRFPTYVDIGADHPDAVSTEAQETA